jgi:hypothetical protein
VQEYEIVFRREGEDDEVVAIGFEHLVVGQTFPREGVLWRIAMDDGPSELHGCVVRLIAVPADSLGD